MSLAGLEVVHALPERVRLKVAKVKGDPAFAREVEARLGQVPGIKGVEAKPATGSVIIHFTLSEFLSPGALPVLTAALRELFPEIDPQDLVLGLGSLTEYATGGGNSPATGSLVGSLAAINTRVAQVTGGLDLKLLVPLSLVFFGVRSLLKSEKAAFPSWYDYFWFAFSSFVMLNRRTVEGRQESGETG